MTRLCSPAMPGEPSVACARLCSYASARHACRASTVPAFLAIACLRRLDAMRLYGASRSLPRLDRPRDPLPCASADGFPCPACLDAPCFGWCRLAVAEPSSPGHTVRASRRLPSIPCLDSRALRRRDSASRACRFEPRLAWQGDNRPCLVSRRASAPAVSVECLPCPPSPRLCSASLAVDAAHARARDACHAYAALAFPATRQAGAGSCASWRGWSSAMLRHCARKLACVRLPFMWLQRKQHTTNSRPRFGSISRGSI